MNIIEAIKSLLPFRRKDWKYAAFITPHKNGVGMQFLEIDYDSICADDWEIEIPSVTITREQFDAAWRRAEDVCENMEIKTSNYLYELVVRELGL